MAEWLSVAALLVSVISAIVTFIARGDALRSAQASERSASIAEAADHRARVPQIDVLLSQSAPVPTDRVIYQVRNNGPQDLDDIIVYRPRPSDRITYPVAITGSGGWAADEIHLGSIALGLEARFTLCCGVAEDLPEFRVRIECCSGEESWTITCLLPPPRSSVESSG